MSAPNTPTPTRRHRNHVRRHRSEPTAASATRSRSPTAVVLRRPHRHEGIMEQGASSSDHHHRHHHHHHHRHHSHSHSHHRDHHDRKHSTSSGHRRWKSNDAAERESTSQRRNAATEERQDPSVPSSPRPSYLRTLPRRVFAAMTTPPASPKKLRATPVSCTGSPARAMAGGFRFLKQHAYEKKQREWAMQKSVLV